MSSELARALACYREWLEARQQEQKAARRMCDRRDTLTNDDCEEYDRRIEDIRREFED